MTRHEFLNTFLAMTDNRKAGFALITGALGSILTMAIHPVAGGMMSQAQVERLALMSGIAHSLAMVSSLALFLGCCGLARRIQASDRIGFAALVLFGFSTVAVLIATAVSGFIVPNLIRQMAHDIPNTPFWRIAIVSMFQVNQSFAAIFSVTALAAIVLWSAGMLRLGGFSRALPIYGCLVPPPLAILIVIGRLPLNVHGMGVVAFAMAIWFVGAGSMMLREAPVPTPVT